MKLNAIESADTLESEQTYPQWAENYMFTQGDNFTDNMMIKTAIVEKPSRSVFENAILNDSI